MNAKSKNWKATSLQIGLWISAVFLFVFARYFHLPMALEMSLRQIGLASFIGSLIPMLYENWTQHGKSKQSFILVTAIFVSIPLIISAVCLLDNFSNSH